MSLDMMKLSRLTSFLGATVCTAGLLMLVLLAAQPAQAQVSARGRVSGDGQGNVHGAAGSGFNTAAGGQGLRTRSFDSHADGSVTARNQASVSTANGGSASSQASYTRSAGGSSASGQRSTSVSNARTGVTFDGSTTYTKGSGVSRSASCTDAAGNTVTCGANR